jgi:ABC-type Fe3+ transport system substrate-binding protein
MTRYLAIIGFLVVLAVPLAARSWMGLAAAPAPSAGVETIVVVTPDNVDIRNEFARAFSAWHLKTYGTAVQIDYRSVGGTNDIRRLLDAFYRAHWDKNGKLPPESEIHPEIDVVFGGGDFMFDQQLKPDPISGRPGDIKPIPIDPAFLHEVFPEPTLAGVKLYDTSVDGRGNPTVYWIGACLSSFGIVFNADLCQHIGVPVPRTWSDLADPRFADLLALADPTHSGSAAAAYMMVLQRAMADSESEYLSAHPDLAQSPPGQWSGDAGYNAAIAAGWKIGMGRLVLIAANARYFTDSGTVVPTDVGNGEAAAGIAIDFFGRVESQTVGPDRAMYVGPIAATAITPDSVAILYGVQGRRLELSMHFIEFLLSKPGQLLWDLKAGEPDGPVDRALRRSPIRRDLYGDQTGWADPVNPFEQAGGFNTRAAWSAMQGDTVPFWGAAWIDSRDDLIAAYDRILAVDDVGRRSELLGRLADLPITLADFQDYTRSKAKQKTNVDLWLAGQRIHWAERFAAHYREVGDEAGGKS